MKLVTQIKDKVKRHQERHTSTGFRFVIADSLDFLPIEAWKTLVADASLFMQPEYISALESHSPENTQQRYVIAFDGKRPVVAVACQIAEVSGENLTQVNNKVQQKVAEQFKERVLVCGNLISSGLHGVAFDPDLDESLVWKIVSEALYKIRRAEHLDGVIDFVLLKDLKGEALETSKMLERSSYRKIQCDPDMLLTLDPEVKSFDEYLSCLTSKYRSRAKKIIKSIDKAGYYCEQLNIDEDIDAKLHQLYLQVENKSSIRLASVSPGYFKAMADTLGEKFCCYGITKEDEIVAFITMVKDGDTAVAYYVGFDYQENAKLPLYFRLLQLVVEWGIEQGCQKISFGRTAPEPKANLGAKPVDTYVWVRHRVPIVNLLIRQLFSKIPFEEAPERSALKQ